MDKRTAKAIAGHEVASEPCPKCGRRELQRGYAGTTCNQVWPCPTCGAPQFWHSLDDCPSCRYFQSIGVKAEARMRLRDAAYGRKEA